MEVSLIADTVTAAAAKGLGFANFLLNNQKLNTHLSFHESEQPSSAGTLQISALIFPLDAVAPPPVRSNVKTAPRRLARKTRRTRRRSLSGGGGGDPQDGGFFGDAGDGSGPFGGGFSGSGGGGWNFDGFGGSNWDSSSSDPAFDVVYGVICWIALSNCLHFAFKKVMRFVADGVGDPAREKVTPIC